MDKLDNEFIARKINKAVYARAKEELGARPTHYSMHFARSPPSTVWTSGICVHEFDAGDPRGPLTKTWEDRVPESEVRSMLVGEIVSDIVVPRLKIGNPARDVHSFTFAAFECESGLSFRFMMSLSETSETGSVYRVNGEIPLDGDCISK